MRSPISGGTSKDSESVPSMLPQLGPIIESMTATPADGRLDGPEEAGEPEGGGAPSPAFPRHGAQDFLGQGDGGGGHACGHRRLSRGGPRRSQLGEVRLPWTEVGAGPQPWISERLKPGPLPVYFFGLCGLQHTAATPSPK